VRCFYGILFGFAIARADWVELVEQRDANFTFASGD